MLKFIPIQLQCIGDEAGCFNTPYDVTVDTNDSVIVADAKNHRIQVFVRLVPNYDDDNNNNIEMNGQENGLGSELDYGSQNGDAKEEDYDASGSEDENIEPATVTTGSDDQQIEKENSDVKIVHDSNEQSRPNNVRKEEDH